MDLGDDARFDVRMRLDLVDSHPVVAADARVRLSTLLGSTVTGGPTWLVVNLQVQERDAVMALATAAGRLSSAMDAVGLVQRGLRSLEVNEHVDLVHQEVAQLQAAE